LSLRVVRYGAADRTAHPCGIEWKLIIVPVSGRPRYNSPRLYLLKKQPSKQDGLFFRGGSPEYWQGNCLPLENILFSRYRPRLAASGAILGASSSLSLGAANRSIPLASTY
jgi:hypothetical protein